MLFIEAVVHQMLWDCPTVPPEIGGLLGGRNSVITHIIFDKSNPVMSKAQYTPNISFLNKILADWAKNGIEFLGMFHSHPNWETELSQDDKLYITRILQILPENQKYWFPIVIPQKEILAFSAHRIGMQICIEKENLIYKKFEI